VVRLRDDGAGIAVGEFLIAKATEDVRKFTLVVLSEDVRGGALVSAIHAHIEGRIDGVGEAPLGFI
jgi:hypothetical protein